MQLGRHCGVLAMLFVIFLCVNIVIYFRSSRASFSPKATASSSDFCFSHILAYLNMSDVIAPKSDKRHSPVVKLAIPPYPLDKVPAACRKLFEPLHAKRASKTEKELSCYLKNYYAERNKAVIRSNVLRLVRAFDHEKIDLILDSGSLIGSWRHHGIIPYDDDVDFRIRREDKPRVRKLFDVLCARHGDCYFRKLSRHWKLHIGCQGLKKTGCYMQLDFFFYWLEGDVIKIPESPYSFPKSVLFPLIQRPFEGVLVKAIGDYPRYYKRAYSKDLNECRSYNHDGYSRCKPSMIDCNLLQPFQPYVRSFADHRWGHLEFLVHKRKIMDVFYNPNN